MNGGGCDTLVLRLIIELSVFLKVHRAGFATRGRAVGAFTSRAIARRLRTRENDGEHDKGELIDLAWAYEQALGFYAMKTAPLFYGGGD